MTPLEAMGYTKDDEFDDGTYMPSFWQIGQQAVLPVYLSLGSIRKPQTAQEPVEASTTQVGGDHYKSMPIQPWDIIDANDLNYYEGNVLKYLLRHRAKNGVEDLKKARHYLDKLIEVEEGKRHV